MAVDRSRSSGEHEVECFVFSKDKQAPSCAQVMETYAGAGGAVDVGVRVTVEKAGGLVCSESFSGRPTGATR
jgi:hypothetical protein